MINAAKEICKRTYTYAVCATKPKMQRYCFQKGPWSSWSPTSCISSISASSVISGRAAKLKNVIKRKWQGNELDVLEQHVENNTEASDSEVNPAYRDQLLNCVETGISNAPLHCAERGRIRAGEEPSCRNQRSGKTSHSLEPLAEIKACSRILRCTQNRDVGIGSDLESR